MTVGFISALSTAVSPPLVVQPAQLAPWWPFSAGDTILIIGAVFNGLLLLLTAWQTWSIKRIGQVTQNKVDVVHDATNSRLSTIDGELRETRMELAQTLTELRAARAMQRTTEQLAQLPEGLRRSSPED